MNQKYVIVSTLSFFIIVNLFVMGFIYYYLSYEKVTKNLDKTQVQENITQNNTDIKSSNGVISIPFDNVDISKFNIKDINENIMPITQVKKKLNLIYFWTSWCPNCKVMTKRLQLIKEKIFDETKDLKFISINIDQDVDAAKKYIKDTSYPFEVFFDINNYLSIYLNVKSIPYILLADSNMKVFLKILGWDKDKVLIDKFKSYL